MRRLIALFVCFACLTTAACGFEPMYGSYGTNPDVLAQVEVDTIPTKYGQQLRNALIDGIYRKGTPSNPRYSLKVTNVSFRQDSLGLDKLTTAETRNQLTVFANYYLIDKETRETIYQNEIRSFVAYNTLDSQFTTIVARNDAIDRGLNKVSERIVQDVTLYFGNPNKEALKPKKRAAPSKKLELEQERSEIISQ